MAVVALFAGVHERQRREEEHRAAAQDPDLGGLLDLAEEKRLAPNDELPVRMSGCAGARTNVCVRVRLNYESQL